MLISRKLNSPFSLSVKRMIYELMNSTVLIFLLLIIRALVLKLYLGLGNGGTFCAVPDNARVYRFDHLALGIVNGCGNRIPRKNQRRDLGK